MAKASNELIVPAAVDKIAVFSGMEGAETFLKPIEAHVRSIQVDITTEKGRAACASLAFKVARTKTAIEEIGKEMSAAVSESRRTIKERLDALRDEVRKPLTDWENADAERRAGHEAAMQEIRENGQVSALAASRVIQARLDWIADQPERDWEEFDEQAAALIEETAADLKVALAAAQTREAEKAELDRLRQEAAARAEQERQAAAVKAEDQARIQKEEEVRRAIRTITGGPIDIIESGPVETEESDLIPPTSPGDAALVEADADEGRHRKDVETEAVEALIPIVEKLLRQYSAPNPISSLIIHAIANGEVSNVRIIY